MLTVLVGCPVLDQGEPGRVEFLHVVDGLAGDRPHRRSEQRAHAGKHVGIYCVGLGMGSSSLGKTPRL